ncbi:unnamed protein product [Meloidogyne enterolobii]|uniref:Uncharacterized protein n=1 Tax=Meloidogyne enterolobii TaxID=390850 RepID=A0ACB1A1H6_MELEN
MIQVNQTWILYVKVLRKQNLKEKHLVQKMFIIIKSLDDIYNYETNSKIDQLR